MWTFLTVAVLIWCSIQGRAVDVTDMATCQDQKHPGDTDVMKVSPLVKNGLCKYQSPAVDNSAMLAACADFCKVDSEDAGLPLLLGSQHFGFELEDMNRVCKPSGNGNGLLVDDSAKKSRCQANKGSLRNMEDEAASFIAEVEKLKARQLAFQVSQENISQTLTTEITSSEFKTKMAQVGDSGRPESFRSILDKYTKMMQNDEHKTKLSEAMSSLNKAGKSMIRVVGKELAIFERWLDECNLYLLGTSATQEYLLDICARDGQYCLEEKFHKTSHVGCCCAINPLTLDDTYDIDGEDEHRRLTSETEKNSAFELLAEAKSRSSEVVQSVRANLASTEAGRRAMRKQDDAQRNAYQNYYDRCARAPKRRLHEHMRGSRSSTKSSPLRSLQVQSAPGRKLAEDKCEEPSPDLSKNGNKVEVAQDPRMRDDTCGGLNIDDAQMQEQCVDFCGELSIPLLFGSDSYGFDVNQVKTILLDRDPVLTLNHRELDKCLEDAEKFQEIFTQTSGMAAAISVFSRAKLYYTAAVRKTVEKMQEYLTSTEFKSVIDKKSALKKTEGYLEEVNKALEQGDAEDAKTQLNTAKDSLREAMTKLKQVLDENSDRLTHLIGPCNKLFLPKSSEGHGLLDICTSTGMDCFDKTGAQHVSCTCGFNPANALGSKVDFPIAGFHGRRLTSSSHGQVDIIAESYTAALPKIQQLSQKTKDMNGQDLLASFEKKRSDKYGENYCSADAIPAGGDESSMAGGPAVALSSFIVGVMLSM